VALDGTGAYDAENDTFTLEVTIGECAYTYERAGEAYTAESSCG
jgi:hypothetical protein